MFPYIKEHLIRLYLDTIQMTLAIPSTTTYASTIQQTGCFRHVDKFKLIVKQVPPNNQSLLPFFSPARGDKLNSEYISQLCEILSEVSYFYATAFHKTNMNFI